MENKYEISSEILGAIDRTSTIKEKEEILFKEWNEIHSREENWHEVTKSGCETKYAVKNAKKVSESYKISNIIGNNITFPGIEQGSFVRDGLINEEKYVSSRFKILFILREANIFEERNKDQEINQRSSVQWFNDFINGNTGDSKSKLMEKLGCISFLIENMDTTKGIDILGLLANPKLPESEVLYKESLDKIAIMNINKRGGASKSIDWMIKGYFKKYQDYISKQIEIIDPDYIFLLGTGMEQLFDTSNNNCLQGKRVLELWHPSYRISNGIKSIKENLSEIEELNKTIKDKNISKYIYEFARRFNSIKDS